MAYETTEVPVAKSQEAIRKLIYAHKGTSLALVSQPPREGFDAMVTIQSVSYHIRIMATCQPIGKYDKHGYARSEGAIERLREQEYRRVWRVLYWHLKAMFEAADSGVIDIRDVIMPYIVLRDERTLSEALTPFMPQLMTMDTARLLPAATEEN